MSGSRAPRDLMCMSQHSGDELQFRDRPSFRNLFEEDESQKHR